MSDFTEDDWKREKSLNLAIRLFTGEWDVGDTHPITPTESFMPFVTISLRERLTLPPIQVLALAVLRYSEDEATISAFLDEVMESRKGQDEPVTEEWCKKHGWLPPKHPLSSIWYSPKLGEIMVSIGFTFSNMDLVTDFGKKPIEIVRNPTVSQAIRLCRALGIPWSASDPLGK